MRTLYIECNMGAAGDMLAAALYELLEEKEAFLETINNLGLEDVKVSAMPAVRCGVCGTHMEVLVNGQEECGHHHDEEHHEHHHEEHEHHHEEHEHHHDEEHHGHHHATVADIYGRIEKLHVSDKIKKDIQAVYDAIARAESQVHGKEVTQIHFHEVGDKDALADIAAVCILMDMLAPDKIVASSIHVGSGQVHCAHGVLPVPAPATAVLLQGVPIYSTGLLGELCTPTGAALLKHFVQSFGPMPQMAVEKTGYGMGKKEFETANCVRAFLGESEAAGDGEILELSCNLDDMTPEEIGFATEALLEAGARDVYTVSVGMKKNRPGVLLCAYCDKEKKDELLKLFFRHTTTLGVRENTYKRYTLERHVETKNTPFGEIRRKTAQGYGVTKEKYEYEDLRRAAKENSLSIYEIRNKL